MSEEKILTQFTSAVASLSLDQPFAKEIAKALNEVNRKARTKTTQQAEEYKRALKALEEREDLLYDHRSQGIIDDYGYRRQLQRVREERSHFTKLLTDANLAIQDIVLEKAETIFELAMSAKSLWETMDAPERRAMLNKLVSNALLDGPTLRFELKKPFAMIVKMKEEREWRTRSDSNARPPDS